MGRCDQSTPEGDLRRCQACLHLVSPTTLRQDNHLQLQLRPLRQLGTGQLRRRQGRYRWVHPCGSQRHGQIWCHSQRHLSQRFDPHDSKCARRRSLPEAQKGITGGAGDSTEAVRGEPEDLAPFTVWLASDQSAHVNGHVFHVTGGLVSLLNEPEETKTIHKDGRWTVEELIRVFPATLGLDLPNPAPAQPPPRPLPKAHIPIPRWGSAVGR